MKNLLKKTTIFSIILTLFTTVMIMLPTPTSAAAIDNTLKDIESSIGLKIGKVSGEDITFGVVLSALLPILCVWGMILFSMLIWGGFEILAGAQDTKAQEAENRITAAAIGFILLFVSYWLAQLLQFLLGINILGKNNSSYGKLTFQIFCLPQNLLMPHPNLSR